MSVWTVGQDAGCWVQYRMCYDGVEMLGQSVYIIDIFMDLETHQEKRSKFK